LEYRTTAYAQKGASESLHRIASHCISIAAD
jgi:hypothetical protein